MSVESSIIQEVKGLYTLFSLHPLRRTPNVTFDYVPFDVLKRVDGIDRVVHQPGAVSPGPVGDVQYPWYMHLSQDDNLMVVTGERDVDIYTPAYGKILTFGVSAEQITLNNKVIYDGPAMLVWPKGVFHRVRSEQGSATINFARRYDDFDITKEFNIYDVNIETGEYHCIRPGHLDQPENINNIHPMK